MQFSSTLLFALASVGVLAAPSSIDTSKVVHVDGITMKLADEHTVQRLDVDGNVLDEASITADQLAEFNSMAVQPLRRDENTLVQRACLIGLYCQGNAICWFNGCDGCSAGGCFGSLY